MDARFSTKSVGLSGVRLSIILAAALLAAAFGLDIAAGREFGFSEQLAGPLVAGAVVGRLLFYSGCAAGFATLDRFSACGDCRYAYDPSLWCDWLARRLAGDASPF